ncbi:MAG: DUF3000 domain-containing protein [Acidimicrobiales bacterium]|nr:MAG: DUF3000 domain-containing protein [Acidimicrobiales bacterium]
MGLGDVAELPTAAQLPARFCRAVASARTVDTRPEISLEEIEAPRRIAPYSFALGASVLAGDEEPVTGRLILLHDPAGHPAWQGETRIVSYVTAELEPDIGHDALFAPVGWAWLTEALHMQQAGYRAIAGTITQISSTRFGEMAGPEQTTDVEMRASWTPEADDIAPHVRAWCALLASTAGLPPPGVHSLPTR